jgi:hypothetical protein
MEQSKHQAQVAAWIDQLELDDNQRQMISTAVHLSHWTLILFLNVMVFMTSNRLLLALVVWGNVVVLTMWYLFGNCILTQIENQLSRRSVIRFPNGVEVGDVSKHLRDLFHLDPAVTFYVTSCFPLGVTTLSLIKLIG